MAVHIERYKQSRPIDRFINSLHSVTVNRYCQERRDMAIQR